MRAPGCICMYTGYKDTNLKMLIAAGNGTTRRGTERGSEELEEVGAKNCNCNGPRTQAQFAAHTDARAHTDTPETSRNSHRYVLLPVQRPGRYTQIRRCRCSCSCSCKVAKSKLQTIAKLLLKGLSTSDLALLHHIATPPTASSSLPVGRCCVYAAFAALR